MATYFIAPYGDRPNEQRGWRGATGLGQGADWESSRFAMPAEGATSADLDAGNATAARKYIGNAGIARTNKDWQRHRYWIGTASNTASLIRDYTLRARVQYEISQEASYGPSVLAGPTDPASRTQGNFLSTLWSGVKRTAEGDPSMIEPMTDAARAAKDRAADLALRGAGVIKEGAEGYAGLIKMGLLVAGIIAVGYAVRAFK